MSEMKTRVLCVDDEPNILSALKRQLYGRYDITTAESGAAGLKTFNERGPFPIIVSDMCMPGMDGATFLEKIRHCNRDTIRILLTGQADLDSAMAAVNKGYIFRFLTKPCSPEALGRSLGAAEEQYRLITAEKILLEQTLQGSIKTLVDVLSLASPNIFSQANRMKVYLKNLLPHLPVKDKWPIEVATMLSQIGVITLPDEVMKKMVDGEDLYSNEKSLVENLPQVGERLLSHIPRLEPVCEILLYQEKHFDGCGSPKDSKKGEEIPLGARVLKILLDYERLESRGYDAAYILDTLRGREGWYDENILNSFAVLNGEAERHSEIKEIPVSALVRGMVLAEKIFTSKGLCLVNGGVEITETVLVRIQNVARHIGIREPLRIRGNKT